MKHRKQVLPGFGLSIGITVGYMGLMVVLPLAFLVMRTFSISIAAYCDILLQPRTLSAFRISLVTALFSASLNAVFGFWVAWVQVRYTYPGRRYVDALIDLPFALPTSVAGIALAAMLSPNGWLGKGLAERGIYVAYTPVAIVIALMFISLPFVIRTVEPVLRELDKDVEEAAASLGAGRWEIFVRILFPTVFPAIFTGFSLAFARSLSEYGSVVFVSGNMPFKTEMVPLLIMTKLEQYDEVGATVVATAMLLLAFSLLFLINFLQWWLRRKREKP